MLPFLFKKDSPNVEEDQRWLAQVIDEYNIFPGLSKQDIEKLIPSLRVKRFEDEEILCHCPDSDHDAFLTLGGTVAITYQKEGEEYVLELTGLGSAFNVSAVIQGVPTKGSARALGQVDLIAIDAKRLKAVFKKEPGLGYSVLRTLCALVLERCERYMERIFSLETGAAGDKPANPEGNRTT